MLHYVVEEAFDTLLCNWRAHHDITTNPKSTLGQKVDARTNLDTARDRMHRLRLAMYAETHEMEDIVDSVFCESFDMVVHFRWDDRDSNRPGNFRCVCGELVAIDWNVTGLET